LQFFEKAIWGWISVTRRQLLRALHHATNNPSDFLTRGEHLNLVKKWLDDGLK
jgi:hypothetical protein